MPEINRRQAMVPAGGVVIENPNGSAPGLWLEHDGRLVLLLPGPPRELKPMFERVVIERLAPRAAGARVVRRLLKIAGRGESLVEEKAQPIYSTWRSGACRARAPDTTSSRSCRRAGRHGSRVLRPDGRPG